MVSIKKNKKIVYHIGLMIMAVSLSPLSVNVVKQVFRANFIEPFLFLGFVLLLSMDLPLKSLFIRTLRNKKFLVSLYLLAIFAVIGILTGNNVAYVYSDFRAILIFSFFAMLIPITFNETKRFTYFVENLFIYISLYEALFLLTVNIDRIRFITLCACPFFVAIISLKDGQYLKSMLFVIIICLESAMSAMRINYLFLILYILYVFYIVFVQKKNFKKKMIFLFCFFILIISSVPIITSYLKADDSRYLHTVIRFERLFEEDSNEEKVREDTNLLILNEANKLIVPQGIGWQNHTQNIQLKFGKNYNVLSSMDSNLLYCTYHFGLIFGGGLIIFMILQLFYAKKILTGPLTISDKIINIFIRLCILSMFVLKSWMFVYFSFGFIYGILMFYISPRFHNIKKHDNSFLSA